MTQKLWLKKLKLNYSSNVIDIVQFGSSIFEDSDPNDIDMGIIFKKIPIRTQLEESQKIKNQLEKKLKLKFDVKPYDFYSLLHKSNFAREGILFYGKSILSGKEFAKQFGLTPKIRIKYDLSNLKKKEKVKFNYTLSGKQKSYGLLRKYNGRLVSPKIVEINPEHEKIFMKKLLSITKKLEIEKIFIQGRE
jgi:hypothetical protein